MKRQIRDQRGFTLVETLLAAALLVVVITSTMSVMLAGQRSTRHMTEWTQHSQSMRVAMRQIAEDVQYAWWDPATATNGQEFTVNGYSAFVEQQPPWTGPIDWPGDLADSTDVFVTYKLEGDSLVREVQADMGLVSRQVVMTGLTPYTAGSGSYLQADPLTRLVKVMLRTTWEQAGVNSVAEVYSEFYLQTPPSP